MLVSASIDLWLKDWCKKYQIELIATKLEFKNEVFIGKFSTPNCHGPEKVKRVKEIIDLKNFKRIYAYGDSNGDKDLLAIATDPFYKPFS